MTTNGAAIMPAACVLPSKWCAPYANVWAQILLSSTACRCSTWWEGGGTFDETVQLAQAIEAAGATIINTGIGWHEARIPTIATPVPRAAFSWVTRKLKGKVSVPLVTTNRINDPQVAEEVIARGDADMVSMARPFLADAAILSKAQSGRADEINTCIGCNQACLDQIFAGKVTSCLVNPRACHETKMPVTPAVTPKRLAVVGAVPPGWRLR
ncbi:2,4-dienoyl-CoA reductase [Enterobacter cancerogenus]|uniref:2,4-dienoyl-CoA reductase n=1 Tax=Enterobacter cancerogenus TaxID=69218 RepID=A0A484WCP0_9ENTR|nr:2,4-dienoyl-CoA reductase [Enterobacter cancerogenus]